MFDSLDEQMKHDDAAVTPREKYTKYGLISLVTLVVVGAVVMVLQMME